MTSNEPAAPAEQKSVKAETKATEAATEEVQSRVDEETERGFRGVEVDPTPNEHYTVAGVGAGLPTPESDPEHAAMVAAHLDKLSRGVLDA